MLKSDKSRVSGTKKPSLAVVIDTSTIIAAIFWGGKPKNVLQSLIQNHEVVLSDEILNELDVFMRLTAPKTSRKFRNFVCSKFEKFVREFDNCKDVDVRDSNDSHVLQLAKTYEAIVVSSDNDLLDYSGDVLVLSVDEALQYM